MEAGLLLFFLSIATPVFASEIETVLMVSIDALHPAALSQKTSPALDRLMRSGRYTLEGRSVTPPQTLIVHTAYFYAKPKLGYLINAAVDEHALTRDDGTDRAKAFLGKPGKRFVFLHISGLEDEGADAGWLSDDYLDELTYIDTMLAPLLDDAAKRGPYLVLVTSDHAGHGRLHGTLHPEDFKLPLIMAASHQLPPLAPGVFHITELKRLLHDTLVAVEKIG